jgi:hypothetical protein
VFFVNKWRLLLGLGLGSLAFLSALNVVYALLKGTQGAGIYQPYLIGELIGQVNAIDYFWGTFIMTIGLCGLAAFYAFPPTMLVERILNTAPKLQNILPDYPEIEALQTVQMNVLDQIQANEQTNAERIESLTLQFQIYHKEITTFMERQEDNARTLLATIPQKNDSSFNELEQLMTERRESVVIKKKPTIIRRKAPKRSVPQRRIRAKKSSGLKVSWRRGL